MVTLTRSITRLQDADDTNVSLGPGTNGYSLVWDNAASKFTLSLIASSSPAGAGTELQYRNGSNFGAIPSTAWNGVTLTLPSQIELSAPAVIKPTTDSVSSLKIQSASGVDVLSIDSVLKHVVGPRLGSQGASFTKGEFSGKYAFKGGLSLTDFSASSEWLIYTDNGGTLTIESLSGVNRPIRCLNSSLTQDYFLVTRNGFAFDAAIGFNSPFSAIGSGRECGLYMKRNGDIALMSSRADLLVARTTGTNVGDLALPQKTYVGGDLTPTAVLDLSGSSTDRSSLRIRSGSHPLSPNSGDIWFDGTDLFLRISSTTYKFNLIEA